MSTAHWCRTAAAIAALACAVIVLVVGGLVAVLRLLAEFLRSLFSISASGHTFSIGGGALLTWCVVMSLAWVATRYLRPWLADEFADDSEWAALNGRRPTWSSGAAVVVTAVGIAGGIAITFGIATLVGPLFRQA